MYIYLGMYCMSEPSYLTLPFRCSEYRVAVAAAAAVAPFTPFDTMYIDSQYSGTRKRLMLGCVDFPRLTSPRLASHLQLQLKLQSTMYYNSAEQSRTE